MTLEELLRNAGMLGLGVARGATADIAGMPVDTLNMVRQGLLGPVKSGNPYARQLAGLLGPQQDVMSSDWIASQMGLPEGQGMAYEAGRMISPSPTDIAAMARRPSIQELITYHGTPHRFEPTPANPLGEFEAAKIGTGEGAQAYGHGVYLAESPDVADTYRAMQSPMPRLYRDGVPYEAKSYAEMLAESRALGAGSLDEAISRQARRVQTSAPDGRRVAALEEVGRGLEEERRILDALRTLKAEGYQPGAGGNLYKVDLPDEMIDRMLDWDKPLSEQPHVLKALDEAGYDEKWINMFKEYPAGEVYKSIAGGEGFEDFRPLASDELRNYGIPGIKYLDQGSRGKGKGTRNFVVFPGEEKKVKILKRE